MKTEMQKLSSSKGRMILQTDAELLKADILQAIKNSLQKRLQTKQIK